MRLSESPWTEGKCNRLRELWCAGLLSPREIAYHLNVTRDAVIGKAHRMELPSKLGPRPTTSAIKAKISKRKPQRHPCPECGEIVVRVSSHDPWYCSRSCAQTANHRRLCDARAVKIRPLSPQELYAGRVYG